MENKKEQLTLKKLTLIAWAKILQRENIITVTKYHKMVARIEKLTS